MSNDSKLYAATVTAIAGSFILPAGPIDSTVAVIALALLLSSYTVFFYRLYERTRRN